MASSGGGATTAAGQLYFCHQCNRTVTTTPSSSDLLCPHCGGGFLEELDSPSPTPSPNPFFSFSSSSDLGGGPDPMPFLFSSPDANISGAGGPFLDHISASLFGGGPGNRSSSPSPSPMFQDPEGFNPFVFLQNYIQTLRAGGANIQFVIDNNSGSEPYAGLRLPANLGDYFIGPGLEQLIQQLAENDPNRYGTPPASKSAIDKLPNIKISEELLASDSSQCAVCKDMFELDEEAKQMPCKHIYHTDCILPWLELHNSCPVCRYELPTDDPEYEQRTQGAPAPGNQTVTVPTGASGDGNNRVGNGIAEIASTYGENPLAPQTVERRLRISLPWPFRGFGSPAEASNSGNNSGNNDRESNSGNRENPNFGSETREEDLD